MNSVRLVGDVLLEDRRSAYQAVLGSEYVTAAASFHGVDLADVANGHAGCVEICREALDAGIRVVAHGPSAGELGDFKKLLDDSDGRLRLAHSVRFDNKYTLPHEESSDRKLGDVITVRVIRTGSDERDFSVEELNVFDALLLFGGEVQRVFTRRNSVLSDDVNTSLSVIRYSNKAIGYGEACTAYRRGYFYEVIEVAATDGMLEYDSFSRTNRIIGDDGIEIVDSYHVTPLQAMVEDYVAHFRGDRVSSVPDAQTMELLDLAMASLASSVSPAAVTA